MPNEANYLQKYRNQLGSRVSFAGPTYDEIGKLWYSYHIINSSKLLVPNLVTFAFMSTHNHFCVQNKIILYKQTAPIINWKANITKYNQLVVSILNSSSALFWLKQICFNKGAGDAEEKDRFEYAGGKVELLPVPNMITTALEGEENALSKRLTNLSQVCSEYGQVLPSLSMKKLFEKEGEAYDSWNRSLPGYIPPHPLIGDPFTDSASLQDALSKVISEREMLRAQMIALQEDQGQMMI